MEERASIVIAGAGVIGASVAFQLARMGARNVVVLEREPVPGAGSTSKANGGIRAQFTTEVNLRMSLLSMEILDGLEQEIGEPPAYRKAGYLFLTDSPEKFAAMQKAAEYQRERGVSVEVLDPAGVLNRVPFVAGENLAGGTFGARDGFIDPGRLCNFFVSEAARLGVSFRYQREVSAVEATSSGEWDIRTSNGEAILAPVFVNAAGAWAKAIAAMAGVDLPVEPVRRHLFLTGPIASLPPLIPMTIDADSGVLVRREGDRVLIAYSNPDEPAGFNTAFDPDFVTRFAEALDSRFPSIAAAGIDMRRSWAGLYEVTPDHHSIIGTVAGRPGLFFVNGFSGHGVMHAPAAGRCVAELILKGRSESADISALSIDRFASGELIHETMVL
ncbi:MAG: FAD-binding oxidoreductase [Thermoanaerobaculia bacterium]|nr:Dimethylglycine oxidase [Thermoanaerobaculia bacterium]MCK6681387.1 FAD-binding oxidoreductase [Thermoanaerobaculia bacterium]